MQKSAPTFFENAERTIDPALCAASLQHTKRDVYWLDTPDRPQALPPLTGNLTCGLLVVGGGYTGLWTALQAKERNPDADVVLIEAGRIAGEASGRNGGFCEASLVHGESNGEQHLPDENGRLTELGLENLAGLIDTLDRYGIECDLFENGTVAVSTEPHQDAWLRAADNGKDKQYLDTAQTRSMVHSDAFISGLWSRENTVLVNPAKLAWGLREACLKLGVKVYEHTAATGISNSGRCVTVDTDHGRIRADRVALGTNAFTPLLKRHSLRTIPVYDYALVTEPLTAEQREAIGWETLHGLTDLNNRFHYSRPILDADGGFRILYGGFDALYRFGGKIQPRHYHSESTYLRLSAHFFATFPALAGLKFSHAWGGVIDTSSRFFAFFDTAFQGKVAYCAGLTGLGVGASRFCARAMLDLLAGEKTEITELQLVRKKPLPFPPEPFAWVGVQAMTAALARADRRGGRRGLLLKTMDAIGMGFDS